MLVWTAGPAARWLCRCWDECLAFGHLLVEEAVSELYDKTDLDDFLSDLERAGWIERGENPSPSPSQVAFASVTYGKRGGEAYPTHYGWSPVRCDAFRAWRLAAEQPA